MSYDYMAGSETGGLARNNNNKLDLQTDKQDNNKQMPMAKPKIGSTSCFPYFSF